MGSGQYDVPDDAVAVLNGHDAAAEAAVASGDGTALSVALMALHDAVRSRGRAVPPDVLVPSDAVLPPADATVTEVRALLGADGLVPG